MDLSGLTERPAIGLDEQNRRARLVATFVAGAKGDPAAEQRRLAHLEQGFCIDSFIDPAAALDNAGVQQAVKQIEGMHRRERLKEEAAAAERVITMGCLQRAKGVRTWLQQVGELWTLFAQHCSIGRFEVAWNLTREEAGALQRAGARFWGWRQASPAEI